MQKLVAIYLSNYTADRMLHEDGDRREYLEEYLNTGWRVISVTPLGSVASGNNAPTSTWAMVLLDKPGSPGPQPPPPRPT